MTRECRGLRWARRNVPKRAAEARWKSRGAGWRPMRGVAVATMIVTGAGLAAPAMAQDATLPAAGPLDAVVRTALKNNLALAREGLAAARAEAEVRETRGRFLPTVAFDSRWSDQAGTTDLGDFINPAYAALNQVLGENRFPTDLSVTLLRPFEARVRVTQPLFDAAIPAGHAAARHARDAQRFQYAGAARRLAAEAQAAYLRVAAARSARRTWEATLEQVRESERVTERLLAAGDATPDALFRARADRSEVEQRLAESLEAEHGAARSLNQLLRLPLDAPVAELPDSVVPLRMPVTLEDAIAGALARREELAGASAGIRASEAGVRAATASFLPRVAVALDYGFQGEEVALDSDDDFAVASLVVSWNLFNGGSDLARRERARLEAEERRLQLAELEDLVRLDVRQAYEGAEVALAAIPTATDRLAAARRTWELVRRRHSEGLASQLELVDARTALTAAELNRIATVHRFALRYVDLERAAALRALD